MRGVPVLIHGYFGFHRIGPIEYFRGVDGYLRESGIEALFPALPATGSIEERAQALAAFLFARPDPAFALVGHSMGGLDARFVASRLDRDRRIKSVTTLATPHQGTAVASSLLHENSLFAAAARSLGGAGLGELTPEARAADPIPDRADVSYRSYAARRAVDELPWLIAQTARYMAGENDGLVPVESARWGDFKGILRSDHLELVGWNLALADTGAARPFDHLRFLREVVLEAINVP